MLPQPHRSSEGDRSLEGTALQPRRGAKPDFPATHPPRDPRRNEATGCHHANATSESTIRLYGSAAASSSAIDKPIRIILDRCSESVNTLVLAATNASS